MSRLPLALLAAITLGAFAGGDDPKPIAVTALSLNTAEDEDEPFVSGGSPPRLFFARKTKDKYDLHYAVWNAKKRDWDPAEAVGPNVRTKVDDRGAWATDENKFPQFLYYATRTDAESTNFDLYVAVKDAAGKVFTAVRPLATVDTEADEMHPWLTPDRLALYFSRKDKDGWRVYFVTRREAVGGGGFGDPKRIDELPADFHHPTLTGDGKTMYLQGPAEKGRWGLFVATKGPKGWDAPKPLAGVAHKDGKSNDLSPTLNRDGSRLYFASDRPGGKGGLDLYFANVADLKRR